MKSLRTLGTVAVAGAVLALIPVGSAMAANTGDTTATFTLEGGSLDVTPAASAALGNSTSGATTITGSLGGVSVTDMRGIKTSWTASAASSAFTGDLLGSSSTAVSYTAGPVTETGTITVADGIATDLTTTAASVVAPTSLSGNNTATWNPTLDVTMPAGALADDYTGTVTTSIA